MILMILFVKLMKRTDIIKVLELRYSYLEAEDRALKRILRAPLRPPFSISKHLFQSFQWRFVSLVLQGMLSRGGLSSVLC